VSENPSRRDGPKNPTEDLVSQICRRNFLTLWSYPNPRGKDDKELCDVLVVCDPFVIIFGVKAPSYSESSDTATGWKRWQKKAIEESAKQIFGAERWLRSATHVIRNDGTKGLPLPPLERRQVYRIAIALGSQGEIPIYGGNLQRKFIHVFEESALDCVLGELDTITDLTDYLKAVEDLLMVSKVTVLGGEEELLAIYLRNQRKFPHKPDLLMIDGALWEGLVQQPEYVAKKQADKPSYLWDRMIDTFSEDVLAGRMAFEGDLAKNDEVLRLMAKESRMNRRILGKGFREFMDLAADGKISSRYVRSPSGIGYVFLARPHGTSRKERIDELQVRCFVVRGLLPDVTTVVGLATERYERGRGFSLDLALLHLPDWTAEHQAQMEQIQAKMGTFATPMITKFSEDEYPGPETGDVGSDT
jgi:hypothetical protein